MSRLLQTQNEIINHFTTVSIIIGYLLMYWEGGTSIAANICTVESDSANKQFEAMQN